ncbi:PREDICTED: homeobox protein NANOG-like [Crocodylus porosus]|uniref:homeobox protein NANOG-like n=1 Tax=Crocodylus porosus TaxID=8502 RepID=UPI00093C6A41|nr:PREDICTED: homeobox protein NANOG-like [Crocodylus porosus]
MSTHLAVPAAPRYGGYYWDCPAEPAAQPQPSEQDAAAPAPAPFPGDKTPQHPDLSPASSSSGMFIQYTPDSATSPNAEPLSPNLNPQRSGAGGEGGVKKAKMRTAFSPEQLQILHQRFQSQKYLSPYQIRELGSALGLTYKQVKTWFQNQRMKYKRYQKESQWIEKGTCLPQNGFYQAGYLDVGSGYYQGCSVSANRNIQTVANVHQAYNSSPAYSSSQSLYTFMAIEDEGTFFGKAASPCNTQQAVGFLSPQKVNFYHGFPTNVDYASVELEESYSFQNAPGTPVSFPGSGVRQPYQPVWHPQGTQSNYNS